MRRYHQTRRSKEDPRNVFIVPAIGLLGVTSLATLLIVLVILRAVPGMGRIFSPDTHSNLWEEVKPDYDRTEVTLIGGPVGGAYPPHAVSASLPQGLSQMEVGERLFIGAGCAMCHGLDGKGGTIAPPVAGASPQIVRAMARFGPGGMPAFSPDILPEDDLDAIAAYIQTLEAPAPEPTPPGPTPETPDPVAQGQRLFSSSGCAACHGPKGEGSAFAPRLAGASEGLVQSVVRSGSGAMPAFPERNLSNEDLATIIAYLQSLGTPTP